MKGWKQIQDEYINALKEHRKLVYDIRIEQARAVSEKPRKYLPPFTGYDQRVVDSEANLESILEQPYDDGNNGELRSSKCPISKCSFYFYDRQYTFCRSALAEHIENHLSKCHGVSFKDLQYKDNCAHTDGTIEGKVMIPGSASHVGAEYDIYTSCLRCGTILEHKQDWL